jgi:hypothetical protein
MPTYNIDTTAEAVAKDVASDITNKTGMYISSNFTNLAAHTALNSESDIVQLLSPGSTQLDWAERLPESSQRTVRSF